MDITYLLLDYPPARFIGAELAAHRFIKWLGARGHTVNVRLLDAESARWHEGVVARPHRTTPLAETDIVLSNAGVAERAAQSYARYPRVVWAHNHEMPTMLDVKGAHPDLVVANTEHMASVLLSTIAERGIVLYPPPAPELPTRVATSARGDAGEWVLVNGSRSKGGALVAEVARALPDHRFLVVEGGHGTTEPDLLDVPNVSIVPQGTNMERVWERARGLLIPSRLESYSMTGFEAAERGVGIIAHDLPGVREALGPAATYLGTREPDQWALTLDAWEPKVKRAAALRISAHLSTRRADIERQMLEVEERMLALVARARSKEDGEANHA